MLNLCSLSISLYGLHSVRKYKICKIGRITNLKNLVMYAENSPATVFEFPVMDPTITMRGGLVADSFRFFKSSSRRLANRKWPKWFVPTLISKPSAVNLGSLAVGRYTAALQTKQSKGSSERLHHKSTIVSTREQQ